MMEKINLTGLDRDLRKSLEHLAGAWAYFTSVEQADAPPPDITPAEIHDFTFGINICQSVLCRVQMRRDNPEGWEL